MLKKCSQKVQATLPKLTKFQLNQGRGHSNIQKFLDAANMNMKNSSNKGNVKNNVEITSRKYILIGMTYV